MLQKIHDKAKGWIAYAIIGMITIPFALWGINQYFEGGGKRPLAVVNGEDVLEPAYREQLDLIKSRAPNANEDFLKTIALDAAINEVVKSQIVKNFGFRASNAEVKDYILTNPQFQVNNKFDPATYQRLLEAQGNSPASFEEAVRVGLSTDHLEQGIRLTSFVPLTAAKQYQALQGQEREVESFTLKAENFKSQVQIPETAINEYYEKNKKSFMTEERIKLAYLDIDRNELLNSVQVNADDLKRYFDTNKDRYISHEERKASHILVTIADPKGPDQEKAAKERATALFNDIKAGKTTFEQAAREKSDDKTSATQDGALGAIVTGDWDPAFEKAVYGATLNTPTEPVQTPSGYEIIKVTEIKPAVQRTFEEAKADAERDYKREETDKKFADLVDKLQKLAFENQGDLAPAAKATGLTVKQSDWVTRAKGDGVFAIDAAREAAFAEDVRNGKNSDVVTLGESRAVVLRSVGFEESKQKSLAEVKESIIQTLTAEETRKLATQKGNDLIKQLKAANNWNVLDTSGLGASTAVVKSGFIKRVGGQLPKEVVQSVFSMTKPATNASTWSGVPLANGDYAIVQLKQVKEGEVKDDVNAVQSFGKITAQTELNALFQSLRDAAKIERFPENI